MLGCKTPNKLLSSLLPDTKNNEETIEIKGDLAKKTFKLRAAGKVAWGVCIGAIGGVIYSAVATVGTGRAIASMTGLTAGFTAATA